MYANIIFLFSFYVYTIYMRKDIYIRQSDLHIFELVLKNKDLPELIHEMLLAYELKVKDEE